MNNDEKVYEIPTITDNPLPGQDQISYASSEKSNSQTIEPSKINNQSFPVKRVAVELLSSALNTRSKKILQEFEFTESGSIQIGKYTNGQSGDVRLTPNGITARDKAGTTTFALDGDTGDAVFKGTVQAGSVISREVIVGNNTWVIDGDPNTPRIIQYENDIPVIVIGEV